MRHMKMTAKILRNFCSKENAGKTVDFSFVSTSPTTLSVRKNGRILVSVSDSGECRFYDGAKIPGLAETAIEEGKFGPLKEAALQKRPRVQWLGIPYPLPEFGYGDGSPVDYEIRAKGDHEVVTHGSKKIVVPATAKYGQSNPTKHGTKYQKGVTAETFESSTTYGKRKIRIRSDGGQSIKTELLRSAFTPVLDEPVADVRIVKSNIKLVKKKMTKRGNKFITREALAMMEHNPCRIVIH